jgi:hypothetical protein
MLNPPISDFDADGTLRVCRRNSIHVLGNAISFENRAHHVADQQAGGQSCLSPSEMMPHRAATVSLPANLPPAAMLNLQSMVRPTVMANSATMVHWAATAWG